MGHPGLLIQDYVAGIPIWYNPNIGWSIRSSVQLGLDGVVVLADGGRRRFMAR
jgi:hypothetical protein